MQSSNLNSVEYKLTYVRRSSNCITRTLIINNVNGMLNVYMKRSILSDYHVWRNLHDGTVCGNSRISYHLTIATFGPKLPFQNKVKTMRAKMKELMLAHNNQIIS
ncbi:MAG: hypothetical protein ACJ71P_18655 [Nitrososphaeraceae archaeon]